MPRIDPVQETGSDPVRERSQGTITGGAGGKTDGQPGFVNTACPNTGRRHVLNPGIIPLFRPQRVMNDLIYRYSGAGLGLDYQSLKARHRQERDGYHINLSLRVHRALSWLDRAEKSADDLDAQYIFLWIAFNAAYANEFVTDIQLSEQKIFSRFLKRLCELDQDGLLYQLVWSEFPGSIRVLLDNKYIFKPFWDYQSGKIGKEEWESEFKRAKRLANQALGRKNTFYVLKIIFSRLYTLRNQILHGGSTWNSSVNKDQKRDGARILGMIVPAVICIMMDNPNAVWGDPCYPVVD